jgi:hypothetical protein
MNTGSASRANVYSVLLRVTIVDGQSRVSPHSMNTKTAYHSQQLQLFSRRPHPCDIELVAGAAAAI